MAEGTGTRISLRPDRTWGRPGSVLRSTVVISGDVPRLLLVRLDLLDLDRVVTRAERRVRAGADVRTLRLGVALPSEPRHGYGLRASVRGTDGVLLASTTTAVEAIEGWWESPRHAALIEYRDALDGARRARVLRDWHVTVAQAYDWMWRHYRYTPPDDADPFTDALGVLVSHGALRAAIGAAGQVGIATLAYGSVYGAESEYVQRHPGDRVFDDAGTPLSLGGIFFINDLRPGSHWRKRLLAQYMRAMRRFRFAGIHMDTYGRPYDAVGADGERAFADLYPGLIDEAARRVEGVRDGRVLFNCVDGFPLDSVAPGPIAALYLELWPPDDRYRHVVDWIDRARRLAAGRAVVIAAYGAAMRSVATPDARQRALESSILLSSVILAAGGYHHTLADGNRLLVEGYYPAAVALRAEEAAELQAAWRFSARYIHLTSGPGILDTQAVGAIGLGDPAGDPIPTSSMPQAGHVWIRTRRVDGSLVVPQLVDLRVQTDDRWDDGREPSPTVRGWRLTGLRGTSPVAASPWTAGGDARALRGDRRGALRLPTFRRWLMVVDRTD